MQIQKKTQSIQSVARQWQLEGDVIGEIDWQKYVVGTLEHLCFWGAHSNACRSIDYLRRSANYCVDISKKKDQREEMKGAAIITGILFVIGSVLSRILIDLPESIRKDV